MLLSSFLVAVWVLVLNLS